MGFGKRTLTSKIVRCVRRMSAVGEINSNNQDRLN